MFFLCYNVSIFRMFSYSLDYDMHKMPIEPRVGVVVNGAFADETSDSKNVLEIRVQLISPANSSDNNVNSTMFTEYAADTLRLPIVENIHDIDHTLQVERSHTFYLTASFFERITQNRSILQFQITSNLKSSFAFNLAYDPSPIDKSLGVIYAAIILLSLYVMIIWEIVDRIFAAILASTVAIAALAFMNERPTMPEILSWIDVETLLLLFGMMTLVAILSDTGLFDYLAVYAFKV